MEQMVETVKLIRQVDPEFKISFQGHYHAETHSLTYMICAWHTDIIPGRCKSRRKKQAKKALFIPVVRRHSRMYSLFSAPAEATWIGCILLPVIMTDICAGHIIAGHWTLYGIPVSAHGRVAIATSYILTGRSSIRMETVG